MRPEQRGSRYGKAILEEAERFVSTSWGAKRLEMDYVDTCVQLACYRRCGYSAAGKRRKSPYGNKGKEVLAGGLELLVIGQDLILNEGS